MTRGSARLAAQIVRRHVLDRRIPTSIATCQEVGQDEDAIGGAALFLLEDYR